MHQVLGDAELEEKVQRGDVVELSALLKELTSAEMNVLGELLDLEVHERMDDLGKLISGWVTLWERNNFFKKFFCNLCLPLN